jgi:hypothetical protein
MSDGRPAKRVLEADESGEKAPDPQSKRVANVEAARQRAKAIAMARVKAKLAMAQQKAGPLAAAAAPTTSEVLDEPERRRRNAAKKAFIPTIDLSQTGMTRIQQKRRREKQLHDHKELSKADAEKWRAEQERKAAIKANPYLAHMTTDTDAAGASSKPGQKDAEAVQAAATAASNARRRRAGRGLNFVEQGSIAARADGIRAAAEARAAAAGARRIIGSAMRPEMFAGGDAAESTTFSSLSSGKSSSSFSITGLSKALAAELGALPPMPAHLAAVVDVEPWDMVLLPPSTRKRHAAEVSAHARGKGPAPAKLSPPDATGWFDHVRTLGLIEHPPVIAPSIQPVEAAPLPLMLTKGELKKDRRQRRKVKEEEKRLQQILGQIQPDRAKIKVSTLARTMQESAAANPTATEALARASEAGRRANHDARNLARKLMPEEKREKQRLKYSEKPGEATSAALFRVLDMCHPSLRFKVGENAKQFYLSGRAVMCSHERVTVVVVEGGSSGVRAFKNLMMRRIAWRRVLLEAVSEHTSAKAEALAAARASVPASGAAGAKAAMEAATRRADMLAPAAELKAAGLLSLDAAQAASEADVGSGGGGGETFCELIWEGSLARRCFEDFRFVVTPSLSAGHSALARAGHGEWWDMAVAAADMRSLRPSAAASQSRGPSKVESALPDLDDLLG